MIEQKISKNRTAGSVCQYAFSNKTCTTLGSAMPERCYISKVLYIVRVID
jgi:hypothetical protein